MGKQQKNLQLDEKKLLKLGKERGFVSQEEILQVFPNPENDILSLDNFYLKLLEAGIDVFETTAEEVAEVEKGATELEKELTLKSLLEKPPNGNLLREK